MNGLGIVLILLICGAAIAVAATVVAKLVTKKEDEKANSAETATNCHYRAQSEVMSEIEREFYYRLGEIFGGRCYIFPNVVLSALLNPEIKGQDSAEAAAHLSGEVANYVLCNGETMQIICVIMLEDGEKVLWLKAAGIPVAVMRDVENLTREQIVDRIAAATKNGPC